MAKFGWDHTALATLRKMKHLPLPADLSMGESIIHRPTKEWFIFGEFAGDEVIVIDASGNPCVLPTDECYAAWNPNRDPIVYERLLAQERSKKIRKEKVDIHHEV